MLVVEGLRVRYGAVTAVDGIDFTVGDGECVALLGPNGAGKTSTLRAVSGLGDYEGTVSLAGHPLRSMLPDRIARLGLTHVPEGRRLFGALTVTENLQVGQTARGKRDARYSMADIFDLFPALAGLRSRPCWALSGGEQQMVAIGRGLLAAPRLLMLDEPSLGLAPLVVSTVFSALAQIKGDLSLLIVEQNTHIALGIADRGYVLTNGAMVMQGPSSELADRGALLDSYLGVRTE